MSAFKSIGMELLTGIATHLNSLKSGTRKLVNSHCTNQDLMLDYLRLAIRSRDVGTVNRLVRSGVNVNPESSAAKELPLNESILCILHDASEGGVHALQIVQLLLDGGAHIDSPYCEITGRNTLMLCLEQASSLSTEEGMRERFIGLATMLVHRDANVNASDNEGVQIIHQAGALGDLDFFDAVLHRGAKIGALDNRGRTVLHRAIAAGKSEMALRALNLHNNAAHASRNGITALHHAAHLGDAALCAILINKGALVDAISNTGASALHNCALMGNVEACVCLLDSGAQIDLRDNEKKTPLHQAAKHGHGDACALLISRGAFVHALDSNGRTPKGLARDEGEAHIGPLIDVCVLARETHQAIEKIATYGEKSNPRRVKP